MLGDLPKPADPRGLDLVVAFDEGEEILTKIYATKFTRGQVLQSSPGVGPRSWLLDRPHG